MAEDLTDLAATAAKHFNERADDLQHLHPELADELRRIAEAITATDAERKAAEQLLGEMETNG